MVLDLNLFPFLPCHALDFFAVVGGVSSAGEFFFLLHVLRPPSFGPLREWGLALSWHFEGGGTDFSSLS